MSSSNHRGKFWAAAFLMATSAIGPGFLTQTTVFTQQLMASFGFVILLSIVLDIGVQLNIWRIITGLNKPAQTIANELLPGLGIFLSLLIAFGALAFNMGNIAGAALGLEVITGMDSRIAAGISALVAISIMMSKEANRGMDIFVKVLGVLMILLTAYVAIVAAPPIKEAIYRSFWPAGIDVKAIITIVGGTVGGYICFAGAHRLLQTNHGGLFDQRQVSRAAVNGILTASAMRILLFLAAFGVLSKGHIPGTENPAADIFRLAAGRPGYLLFGIVMWSAAITSVIGSAFTAISFISPYHPYLEQHKKWLTTGFILFSSILFISIGKPVAVLLWAGLVNGFILPVSLMILLVAAHKKAVANGYQHPLWLTIAGVLIALCLAFIAAQVILR
jgi:Mn2+/Fe2+ NRAMP family transporter